MLSLGPGRPYKGSSSLLVISPAAAGPQRLPLPGTKPNWESSIDTTCLMRLSTKLSRIFMACSFKPSFSHKQRFACLVIFMLLLSSANFYLCFGLLTYFKINFFKKNHSGTLSECQTIWIQTRINFFVGPDMGPNCLPRLPLARKELKTV